MLRDARGNSDLKKRGAAADICNMNQRWIFYDTDFVDDIRTKGNSDWPKYFVFAHEVAHHFNNDRQFRHRGQELLADVPQPAG
jgi:predicted metalloprotease